MGGRVRFRIFSMILYVLLGNFESIGCDGWMDGWIHRRDRVVYLVTAADIVIWLDR